MPDIKTDRSRNVRIPKAVYLIGGIVFVLGTNEFGIAGLLPDIAADLSVSLPRAGLLISAYAIAMVIGTPVLTVLSMRLPHRATLLGALGLFVAGQVLGAMADDYLVLLAARVVTATATGTFWAVAAAVVVGVVDPAYRARALALQMAGLTVANVVGVPLGTVIGQQFGWRVTLWTIAIGAALAAFAIAGAVPRRTAESPSQVDVRAELRVFTSGRLWLALGIIAAFQTAVIAYFGYLAPLVTETAGLSGGWVPIALTLFGIGSLVGVQLGGRMADARPWGTQYVGLGGILFGLLVVVVAAGVAPLALAAAFVIGVAAFAGSAALNARVFGLATAAPRLAGAFSASAFNVGAALGPWLGGLTIAAGWGYRAPSAVGAVLATVAVALALFSRTLDSRVRVGSGDSN